MYDRVFTDRIPDLTERYPEGFGGVDMCEPRDPEYEFWKTVEEAERAERDYYFPNKTDEPKETKDWWVSFWLQDGTQTGWSPVAVPVDVDAGDYIEHLLIEEYGVDYGDIADYGCWDDMMEDDV